AQVQRCRACSTQSVRLQRELVIEVNVGVKVPLLARKACPEQALAKGIDLRDVNELPVQCGAAAAFGGKKLVAGWIEDHARNDFVVTSQSDRHTENGEAMSEVGGAVERIDIPDVLAR